MNEASGGGDEVSSSGNLQTTTCRNKENIEITTSDQEKKKQDCNEKDSRMEAQARPQLARQRRDQQTKDMKTKQQKRETDDSGGGDKDVINWLNKKITKQGQKESKPARNPKQLSQQTDRNSSKVENWRDGEAQVTQKTSSPSAKYTRKTERGRKGNIARSENWRSRDGPRDVTPKTEMQSSSGKGYRKNGWEKQGKDEKPNLDAEKKKQFSVDNGGRNKDFSTGNKKKMSKLPTGVANPQSSSGGRAEDVIQIGANVNVINGKYVSRNRPSEQQNTYVQREQGDSDMQKIDTDSHTQFSSNGSQPQVFVYGGLHVYNMPYVDQQYYPNGQQWFSYGDQEYYHHQHNPNINYNNEQCQDFNQQYVESDRKIKIQNSTNATSSKELTKKLKVQKSKVVIDPNHSVQASALTEQLLNESYECMVCCEKIRCHSSVWNCANCYHVFHLRCVRKWANSPAALIEGENGGWRCPACQNINHLVPNTYYCYCGKSVDPEWNRREGITPHSCGELCKKKRESSDCPHLCNQLCHPGPCPSCPVMVTKSCMCGKMSQQTRCGLTAIVQCKDVCGKMLNCRIHACERVCHEGVCDLCGVDEEQVCYCGKSTRKTKCGSGEVNDQAVDGHNGRFSCENICQRSLDCDNHKCERGCHKGKCAPCKLKPSVVTHCPCGKTLIDKLLTDSQPRQSCLDHVPTCDNICNKVLPCSPSLGNNVSNDLAEHRCKLNCHHGNCGPCDGESSVVCRCGSTQKKIKCSDINEEVYLCDQRCNKKRQCGRHRCNQKCCVDKDHQCELVCGKKLRCGTHTCDEPCHRGYCPPCFMTGFEEVTCHCGGTVMYPPIPCGTPPPECTKPCSRTHACSHPVNHLCHSEETCPPCTVLTKKMCSGNHQLRLNVPCHVVDVSCGMPCGSKLECGHSCIKLCHKPPCDSEPCTQPCMVERKQCGHACSTPCHFGSPCPDVPCKVKITILCKCGRRSEIVPCLQGGDKTALAQFYQRMTTESLANKMKDVQLGQSVDISTVILLDEKAARYIECDDECAHQERARRMAEALGIDENVEPFGLQRMLYSPFLMNEAKNNLAFIKTIEEAFESLVIVAQKIPSGQKSHSFPPMNSNQRRIIHELAMHYICSSVSYDAEPKRNTVITATKASRLPPSTLSSQIERLKNPPAPPPMPFVPSDTTQDSRMMKEAREEKKTKTWAQVPDYFADDFVD